MSNTLIPTRSKTSVLVGHLGAIIAVSFWGLSFVSTSFIMDVGGLSPTEAYVYRFVIAYAIIALFISHKKWFCNNLRDELLVLLCGLSSGSIYFITENTALSMTLTTNVSLLTSTSPLLTALLLGLIYKNERPGGGLIVGSIVAFIGAILVIMNSFSGEAEIKISPVGDMLAISSALCWSIYSLILRRLNIVYDAMFLTRKTFFYGIVTALPFLLIEPHLTPVSAVFSNWPLLGNILFLAVCPSILSFYFWAVTVDKMGALKANNYLYLQPIVTLLAAYILLHDPVSILGIIGLVLVLFGLWLGDYIQKRLDVKKFKR